MEWSATSSDSAANRHGVTMAWLWDYSVVATITGPGFLGSLPPPPPLTSETATSAAAHRHRETPARSGARPCPTSPNITGIQIQCEGAGRRDLCQVVIGHELFIVVEVAHRMRK
ncbi:uncharacterized protein LOC125549453 isoform X6 [Triticum urartu]|uniref:uncharacterized protein LOC125549453 isoform X6 n=1 Tax=Triticum urartu TaxID=4572 RepID=UPI002043A170|nr:uncharacterized protein LOC125549453 isoform X6 [Triticum urartu]